MEEFVFHILPSSSFIPTTLLSYQFQPDEVFLQTGFIFIFWNLVPKFIHIFKKIYTILFIPLLYEIFMFSSPNWVFTYKKKTVRNCLLFLYHAKQSVTSIGAMPRTGVDISHYAPHPRFSLFQSSSVISHLKFKIYPHFRFLSHLYMRSLKMWSIHDLDHLIRFSNNCLQI